MSRWEKRAALEAWKATQPQYERRAKRRLLHKTMRRVSFEAFKRHRLRILTRVWTSIWNGQAAWVDPEDCAVG